MKSKEQSTHLDTFRTKRFVYFAEISAGVLAGSGILLYEWRIALPLFPLIFYLHKNRPKTKDEEEHNCVIWKILTLRFCKALNSFRRTARANQGIE